MKKELLKTLPLALLIGALITGCKKDKDTPAEQNVSLREKSITEAKAYTKGNWKIHYTYGGLTGSMKTVTPNSYLHVLPNDSLYLTLNNSLFAKDVAEFERAQTIFGHTAVLMNFTALNNVHHEWVIDSKKGDTLLLVQNTTEPVTYYMTPEGQ